MSVSLQPLRITTGWKICHNTFYDVAATLDSVRDAASYLTQDMLQLRHERFDCLIDLGWTPEGNFDDGAFHLQVFEGDFLGKRVYDLRSKDKNEIVSEIERLCNEISDGRLVGDH